MRALLADWKLPIVAADLVSRLLAAGHDEAVVVLSEVLDMGAEARRERRGRALRSPVTADHQQPDFQPVGPDLQEPDDHGGRHRRLVHHSVILEIDRKNVRAEDAQKRNEPKKPKEDDT